MKNLILILFDAMTDDEINFTNTLFRKTNLKMYHMAFDILGDKFDSELVVEETFLKIMAYIEEIESLSHEQIEPYCFILLKNEIVKLIKKRNKIVYMENLDYSNPRGVVYNQPLSAKQTKELATNISLLPLESQNILFLGYCFDSTLTQIDKMLETENTMGKLRSAQKTLAGLLGFGSSGIDYRSMKNACQIALDQESKDYEYAIALHEVNDSKDLKHTQKVG